jgi:hypothetical protein
MVHLPFGMIIVAGDVPEEPVPFGTSFPAEGAISVVNRGRQASYAVFGRVRYAIECGG